MSTTRSPQELLRFIVAANGNIPLAAERAGVDRQELVALVTGNDTSTLSENLRAMFILSLYDSLMQAQIAFNANIPFMSPNELARSFSQMATTFSQLTSIQSPDLAGETHDAAAAKSSLITRLEQWKKNNPKVIEAKAEDVS